MSGKRNVSVCIGHELANALYMLIQQAHDNTLVVVPLVIKKSEFVTVHRLGDLVFRAVDLNVSSNWRPKKITLSKLILI